LNSISVNPTRHEERHSLRIAIKKWRYFLEIVSSVLDCDQTQLVTQLKDYQSVLGKMNDLREFNLVFNSLALSKKKRLLLNEILKNEEAKLFKSYLELVTYRPLTYSFLI
jgi:CHAD domain-containing protein